MIKIGNEKLFTMTELLENLAAYLKATPIDDIKRGANNFEISAVAAIIGESADFIVSFYACFGLLPGNECRNSGLLITHALQYWRGFVVVGTVIAL